MKTREAKGPAGSFPQFRVVPPSADRNLGTHLTHHLPIPKSRVSNLNISQPASLSPSPLTQPWIKPPSFSPGLLQLSPNWSPLITISPSEICAPTLEPEQSFSFFMFYYAEFCTDTNTEIPNAQPQSPSTHNQSYPIHSLIPPPPHVSF